MTIQETIKTIDKPKGWLKITPSDIRNLNDYCKKLESENQQLISSGASKSFYCDDEKVYEKEKCKNQCELCMILSKNMFA